MMHTVLQKEITEKERLIYLTSKPTDDQKCSVRVLLTAFKGIQKLISYLRHISIKYGSIR